MPYCHAISWETLIHCWADGPIESVITGKKLWCRADGKLSIEDRVQEKNGYFNILYTCSLGVCRVFQNCYRFFCNIIVQLYYFVSDRTFLNQQQNIISLEIRTYTMCIHVFHLYSNRWCNVTAPLTILQCSVHRKK